ncbi:SDR family NAD(P)-dependent oxidoreductase [Shewanella eurypsychrophilus]|uniref:SDR family NAD(P)-dependent oxidoreductase n=1 Tax=Shewanella eurypsychrophilus TaxID=2593656 RepID=A0ABX6V646_9GAMM|nr:MULTISPECIES: SDR family NAD(P)-dependent oxidoreductase [Shewanella]QFU22705.1 SDR family NAD(P)-dependent oxidoreductase [Shewanella sp. YLB-09]QPG57994.1 SDR family NAD(P)-dependent oxidoreductase [Shewanella eurypsychrophilus]
MIVITGASSGLGAALTKLYSEDGVELLISGRNEQRLLKVAEPLGDKVQAKTANLSQPDDIKALFDACQHTPQTIIHCAGSGYFGALENQQADAINALIENNVTSAIMLLREAVKRYKEQAVTVVIVMSTAALTAKAGESTYCAVKWAVRGLVESVRLELKGCPMKLIAVYPGGMATEFWPSSGKSLDTSGFMSAIEAATMLKQALVGTEHGYVSDITIARG